MDFFDYRNGELYCEDIKVSELIKEYGSPLYIYSKSTILDHYKKLHSAFDPIEHLTCYSVKANSNLSVLNALAKEGSGFDVVSSGEIYRVMKAGGDTSKILYAGVGKTSEEIKFALENKIFAFTVESKPELELINEIAGSMNTLANIMLRVNPDVDPQTHKYITTGKKENKFGVDFGIAKQICEEHHNMPNVRLIGFQMHIGSQITKTGPYVTALGKVLDFMREMRHDDLPLDWVDIGGGYGINYEDNEAQSPDSFAEVLVPMLQNYPKCKLLLEPGRFIAGNAGIMVTEVQYVKDNGVQKFLICDAGMNDLIRPSLYSAYHKIWPVHTDFDYSGSKTTYDVVGPICESGDFFAKERELPELKRGDLVAVFSAGAYGFTMSSNYNSRRRTAEVLVDGSTSVLAKKRETYEDLIRGEELYY